jgi:predicted nucleic acid-binding protein
MAVYFADTWLFIAVLDRFDEHHSQASALWRRSANARIVIHDGVLTELLAFFSGGGVRARQEAVDLTRQVLMRAEVVPVDRVLFLRGLDRYETRPDKAYSLVDCMSMVVMEDRGITHVLTNDHHFRQEGFTVLNA